MSTSSSPPTLSVGEVAKRSGVAVSTLHFYEAKGLIRSLRTEGNQRRYPRGVTVAQRTGMPLSEIREALAALPSDRAPSADDWRTLSTNWRDELDARIRRLTQLRDQLGDCIGCGCLSMTACPLRNPDDSLGAEGAGPRLLEDQGD